MPEQDGREISKPESPEAFGRAEHVKENNGQKDGDANASKKQEKKPFWKRPVLLSVMIGVALLATIVGVIYLIHIEHFESTDDAFIDGRIAHIAPRVAGKVIALKVEDNQIVSADQPLIEIDPEPFEVKLHQAEAALGQSEAQLEQANANLEVAKANAAQSDADVIVAQANSLNAQQDFERFTKVDPAARSRQQLDTATANQRSSEAQVTAAQKKADSMHAMVKASEKTRDSAIAGVQAAKAQVEQAKLDLTYTTVVAGHPGRVTRRTVEVGNYVSVGQEIMDVVGTQVPQDIWVTANFKETQLAKMEKGQPVTITIDAFPDEKLRAHVDSIQNGTGAVFSLLPAENATGNYVKVVQRVPVKIVFDEQPRHMLSPGMSVEPEVDVRDHNQGGNGQEFNAFNSPTRP
jgi:membrane fusion protein (multidrug efflux system)